MYMPGWKYRNGRVPSPIYDLKSSDGNVASYDDGFHDSASITYHKSQVVDIADEIYFYVSKAQLTFL